MTMKKTIAALAASAMAVSAAATVASAQDSIILTYDLNTYGGIYTDGTATVTFTWAEITDMSYTYVQLDVASGAWVVTDWLTAELYLTDADDVTTLYGAYYNADYTAYQGYTGMDTSESTVLVSTDVDAVSMYAVVTYVMDATHGCWFTDETSYGTWASASDMTAGTWYSSWATAEASSSDDEESSDEETTDESSDDTTDESSEDTTDETTTGGGSTDEGEGEGEGQSEEESGDATIKPVVSAVITSAPSVELGLYPFKSSLSGADVVEYLYYTKGYANVFAVINDAIANHEEVTFTFTSVAGYINTDTGLFYDSWSEDLGTTTWYGSFDQHLYALDATGYYGSYSTAWGYNLFSGAVVANSLYTMQLSDTDVFVWTDDSLSFSWFDITEDSKITDAKTLLTSLALFTSVDWYWDTLTIAVGDAADAAVESADLGEGIDGDDDEILDDEDLEVIVLDDEDEEVVVVVEEDEATVVVTTVATSPATGNAPVALAVIPVALAAAAVVAKKRG